MERIKGEKEKNQKREGAIVPAHAQGQGGHGWVVDPGDAGDGADRW